MAWTAKFRNARKANGKWDVAIVYTDGVESIPRGYTLDSISPANIESLRDVVRGEVDRMNANAAETEPFPLAEGADIDLTPAPTPPSSPPPPEQPSAEVVAAAEARAAWLADWHKLRKLKMLADHGLIQAGDPRLAAIAALQTSLRTNWINSYFSEVQP